jgi:hypothetical protein
MSRRKSDPVSIHDMPLMWRHTCGHETVKPRDRFKPPYFVCDGCKEEVPVTEGEVMRRWGEQVKRISDRLSA